MKRIASFIAIMAMCLGVVTVSGQSRQDKKAAKQAEIKKKVETNDYTLLASYVTPQGGGGHPLNSFDYDLKVKKDSVISWLPYFGQAYFDVPYNPTEGGIKFESTKFDYKIKERKKGGWHITILPTDVRNLQQIFIDIGTDGYATMAFNFTNRSSITFNAEIK